MWFEALDGNPRLRRLADKHYSRVKPGTPLFVGPGRKLVLTTVNFDALFVWRSSVYRRDTEAGIECTIFRNESKHLSSDMIREACKWAWQRWPRERLFTYVDAAKVRSSNPGCCFKKAGWRQLPRRTKVHNLIILENTNYSGEKPMPVIEQQRLDEDRRG